MNPKEEVIKLIEDLPDDATLKEIMDELSIWTNTDIRVLDKEKASPQSRERPGRWLN